MVHIDFLSVVVAAIAYMIIKALWYSPYLFGNVWHRLKEISPDQKRNKYLGYFLTFFNALILAYFISLIEIYIGAVCFWDGITVGFLLWFGFVFTTQVTEVIWIKKTYKLFLIRNGFLLFSFIVMSTILVG